MNGDDIGRVLEEYPFDGVLLGYSAANFAFREAALAAAARLGRGVVAMNPLAGGVIPQHPERFSFVKTQADESVVEGALRFLLNDPRLTGQREQITNRLNWHWGIKADSALLKACTRCGKCERNCTQHLPILERFAEIQAQMDQVQASNS